MLPEPPMPLPPRGNASDGALPVGTPVVSESASLPSIRARIRSVNDSLVRTVKTQLNKFGLYRIYSAPPVSVHDPHNPCTIQQSPSNPPFPLNAANPYHPYPNKTSFQLGHWYWNQGVQKSKESFKQLLEVIGDGSFQLEDLKSTNWKGIDRELGGTCLEDEEEWLDADEETKKWHKTTVSVSVPFHTRCLNPGPKDYHTTFYHRNLVSVIQEKLSDPSHHNLFHYDPYEFRWRPPHKEQETRVYGDLFFSDAFLKAHRKLQASPPEPNCELPRVVVGLMFASDATQLSTFGSAKLWPLYLFFGNESKYSRSQPRNNLCTHVAYFQSVSSSCISGV
jgi:Plavaka transposase